MDILLPMFFLSLGLAILCGFVANQKNRNPWLWGFLGCFIPIIALVIVAVMPANDSRRLRECPNCAEHIAERARVCRFCQRDIEPIIDVPTIKLID